MSWLNEIKPKLKDFINQMQEDDFAFVKYSYSGDVFEKSSGAGLANAVYAVKALYISGLLDSLTEEQKDNLYKKIISYNSADSTIHDEVMFPQPTYLSRLKAIKDIESCKGKLKFLIKLLVFGVNKKRYIDTVRAETRQSFAALYLLDKKPLYPFKEIPKTEKEIDKFLDSFNWNTPWHSLAHFSALLFFLRMNAELFGHDSVKLIRYAVEKINRIQSEEDGCWYTGEVSLSEKVNGAMKYFTAIHAANIYDFNHVEKLVDTVLQASNTNHACDNFNIVYCLYAAYKVKPEYRKEEIKEFLLKRLEIYKEFYHEDKGAFSFYKNTANETLYGTIVSEGLEEPDTHGTSLFIWGISIIDEMLDLDLEFKIPVN